MEGGIERMGTILNRYYDVFSPALTEDRYLGEKLMMKSGKTIYRNI